MPIDWKNTSRANKGAIVTSNTTNIAMLTTGGDAKDSFHFCRYRWEENQIYIYADDSIPRYLTASVALDYNTVVGGDKFGNIFVCRLPKEISKDI